MTDALPAWRSRRAYLAMAAPMVALLALFFLWPLGWIVWLSFTEPQPGLGNYERLLTNAGLHRMLWTTVRVSLVTTVATVALAYVVAYAMAGMAGRRLEAIAALLLLPLWSSVVAQAFGWLLLLRSNGLVNSVLIDLGVVETPLELVRNELGVVIGMVSFMLPVATLVLLPNLKAIDPTLALAAKSLGASPARAFRDVFLPESLPGVAGAGAVVLILALGFFGIPAILGGGRTIMIAEYVSTQVLQTARWGVASMLSVVLVAGVCLILIALSRVVDVRRVLAGG